MKYEYTFEGMPEHDLSTPEGQAAYEAEAKVYATLTSEANEIAPLLNQTFKVQFKGSNEGLKNLLSELGAFHFDTRGKEFEAEISWEFKSRPVVKVLKFFGDCACYVYPENLRQIGLLPHMLDAHRKAYGQYY